MAYPYSIDPNSLNFNQYANMGYATNPMDTVTQPLNNLAAPTGAMPTVADLTFNPLAAGNTNSFNAAANVAGITGTNGAKVVPDAANGQGGWLKNTFFNEKGGLNIGNLTSLLGSIGGIYGAIKSYGLAKDQLNFSKETFQKNLENSTKSYNTALEDRVSGRYSEASRNKAADEEYLRRNRL